MNIAIDMEGMCAMDLIPCLVLENIKPKQRAMDTKMKGIPWALDLDINQHDMVVILNKLAFKLL